MDVRDDDNEELHEDCPSVEDEMADCGEYEP
jgi:hypothetical protein